MLNLTEIKKARVLRHKLYELQDQSVVLKTEMTELL